MLAWLQINILNRTNCKAPFGKESCQRSWLRDWKTFCLYTMFGCRFGCKLGYLTKVNPASKSIPPIFLTKNHLPLPKGGKTADFWGCYLLPKFDVNRLFMCKPAVCIGVQWTPLRIYFINIFICNRNSIQTIRKATPQTANAASSPCMLCPMGTVEPMIWSYIMLYLIPTNIKTYLLYRHNHNSFKKKKTWFLKPFFCTKIYFQSINSFLDIFSFSFI